MNLILMDAFRAGFLLIPHTFEFYERQHDWMSDRIRFRRLSENGSASVLNIDENITHQGDDHWVFELLAP